MAALYRPPYTITPVMLRLVADLSEAVGRYSALAEQRMTPQLRRENRLRTIQASLAIENNTLSLEQVTAVIEGKRVLGHPREIQEVRNAFAAYDSMARWSPAAERDLLSAHAILLEGLEESAGQYRRGGVGIYRGTQLVHMAPPANRVAELIQALLAWLGDTQEHPLITSTVFHYELEFIHPFSDGNGRMGRLWQTLILRHWQPVLAYLPVETVIRDHQDGYYRALADADQAGEATPFIEFMLQMLHEAFVEATASDSPTDSVSDPVSDPVNTTVSRLIHALDGQVLGTTALMTLLGLTHRPNFRRHYLNPALEEGWVERTQPHSPNSPTQRYRLTEQARRWLKHKG